MTATPLHIAKRAESQADRAMHAALEAGNIAGALTHAHGEIVEGQGRIIADVETLRSSQEKQHGFVLGRFAELELAARNFYEETRASMARLELKFGTRSASSLSEEAVTKLLGAEAEARIINAKTEQTRVTGRYALVFRVFAAVGALWTLIAIPLLAALAARGCSFVP